MYHSDGCIQSGVAILVCFTLNGYHSVTSYKWFRNDILIVTNPYPVLYTVESGKYKCIMESDKGIRKTHEFTVVGKLHMHMCM